MSTSKMSPSEFRDPVPRHGSEPILTDQVTETRTVDDPTVDLTTSTRRERWICACVVALLAAAVTASLAWVGDDALITLRTALNASHGWGWGFNSTEAVQGYSHPLWFLLWLMLGSLSGNWLLTVMILGVVCTSLAVLTAFAGGRSGPRILAVGGVLLLSSAFVEYATSGLENSLGYLLFASIIVVSSGEHTNPSTLRVVSLGLLCASLVQTRMDYVLLLLPVALVWLWTQRTNRHTIVLAMAATGVPILVWSAWTWKTYGFLLPATYGAKTHLAVPRGQLLYSGWHYVSFSLLHDPAALLLIVGGGVVMAIWGTPLIRAWLVGICAYLAYVVWIGGDFMIGRFMAIPLVIAAATCVRIEIPARSPAQPGGSAARPIRRYLGALAGVALIAAIGVTSGSAATAISRPTGPRYNVYSVVLSDERGGYVEKMGGVFTYLHDAASGNQLSSSRPSRSMMTHTRLWRIEQAANEWPNNDGYAPRPRTVDTACGGLGAIGVLSGPTTHLVDQCALTDRFLATLPGGDAQLVQLPGHMARKLPEGYLDAVRTGDSAKVADRHLAERLAHIWDRIRYRS